MNLKPTNPHPHAETLRAIADGQQMQKKLVGAGSCWLDTDFNAILACLYSSPDSWEFRIKPAKMCELAGIRFPMPMLEAPEMGSPCWVANPVDPETPDYTAWDGGSIDRKHLAASMYQATKEGVIAQGRAMAAALKQAIEEAK